MTVRTEVNGAAAVVTMAWTSKRNAIGYAEAGQLIKALEEAGQQAPRALVITGEGAFCAGGDLAAVAELGRSKTPDEIRDVVYGRFQGIVRALQACPVPTIAAIDGPAVGLGLDIALACDMRFIGPSGWVQQGWARAGLLPGTGGIPLAGRIRAGLIWDLLGEQGRLHAADCDRLELGLASEGLALAAALERSEQLFRYERDVLVHYAQLARACSWPEDRHFTDVANIQSQLLSSPRFQAFAAAQLGRL